MNDNTKIKGGAAILVVIRLEGFVWVGAVAELAEVTSLPGRCVAMDRAYIFAVIGGANDIVYRAGGIAIGLAGRFGRGSIVCSNHTYSIYPVSL